MHLLESFSVELNRLQRCARGKKHVCKESKKAKGLMFKLVAVRRQVASYVSLRMYITYDSVKDTWDQLFE